MKFFSWVFLLLQSQLLFAAPTVVKVGILFSNTGLMADIGREAKNGYQLAIRELEAQKKWKNAQFEVQFFYTDSRSDPALASVAVNELIRNKGVHFILGDSTSTATLAAAPLAQSAKVPLLSPSSTSDKVTLLGDYIFRGCYVDSFQGIAMANYAVDNLKAKTAVTLMDIDLDHSRDVSKVFASRFQEKGGKLLKTLSFSGSKDTSYVPLMTELRSLKPDVIYAPVYYAKMGLIFKQARAFQIQSQFLGTDAWDSPQLFHLAEGATEGALLTSPFSYQNPDARVQKFRAQFKSEFKVEPSSYAALAYDSVFILEDTLSRMKWPVKAENLSQEMRDHVAQTKNVQAVSGVISLDEKRNVLRPDVQILRLLKDGYVYQSRVAASGGH